MLCWVTRSTSCSERFGVAPARGGGGCRLQPVAKAAPMPASKDLKKDLRFIPFAP